MKKVKIILGVFVFVIALILCGFNVKAEEMSAEFKSYLNEDGKFVMNSIVPPNDDHFALLVDLNTYDDNYNWNGLSFSNVANDYSEFDLTINTDEKDEETHRVKFHWNYDEKANTKIQNFINTVIKNKTVFKVSDLELVNYYYNRIKNEGKTELTMFSGELKEALNYGNLEFNVSVRGGSSAPLRRETIGFGYFSYAGSIYHVINPFGTTADHIIYVPTETENSIDALKVAAQERIDQYLGTTDVEVNYLSTAWEYWVRYQYENTKDVWQIDNPGLTLEQFEQLGNVYMPAYTSFEEGFESELEIAGVSETDLMFSVDIPIDENMGDGFEVFIRRDSSKMINPINKSLDLSTEIEISTDKTIPLDTIIQANKLTSGTEYDKIVKILNLTENLSFDLKLYSESLEKYISKLEDGTFKVKIPVPDNFKGKDLVVYYVDENGKIQDYKVTLEGDYAVFNTNHFSIYTLGYKTEQTPNTFDGITTSIIMGIISLMGCVSTIIYFKTKNKVKA